MYRLKQFKLFRFLICALRIPYIFIFLRGHIARKGAFPVDAQGEYIPWVTYPFIDYMNNLDLSDCRVYEFGAGSSSFWWARKAVSVSSVEMEKNWYDFLKTKLQSNMQLTLAQEHARYSESINDCEGKFDIVVVDGAERYQSAKNSLNKLSGRGLIVLDNCDWYPNTAKMIRDNGFVQLDFYGFPPSNSFPSVTSLFYRNDELLRRRQPEPVSVIGGNVIPGGALDDG